MKKVLWIKNGRVIDPAVKRDEAGDVFAVNGIITESLSPEEKEIAEVIDAGGKVVCPGFVDLHVHFREPGQIHKESIATGSWAAAAGGFTTVVCMPNTNPPCDSAGTIQLINDKIARGAVVNVYPTGCITIGRKGKELAPIGSLKRSGVVAITDDGDCIQNNELMRRGMEYAKMFGLVVMDHCQDASLTQGSVMNEGEWSLRLGLRGWPNAAEDIIVARNIILATHTGAHIHLQHISSATAIDHIRRAKKRGVPVTAEAMPHHLALTDACLKDYDTNFKMNPPLRTEEDRQALIEGVLDGTIDIIATDHAPHTQTEKDCEFDYAPFGIIGLETCFSVCYEVLVDSGRCDLPFLISRLTHKPAEILNLPKGTLEPGRDADICILDPEQSWKVDPSQFFSRSSNSPWNGSTLKGKVVRTIVYGNTVFDGEAIIPPESPDSRILRTPA